MSSAPPSPALRPLVIRFGAFGDMVLMIPVLNILRDRYGAPCEVVSSGGWTPALLERVPAVERGWLLTSRRAPYWLNRSQQQLVAWLRRRPAGPVYVFEPDEKPLTWLRRAGVPVEWICTLRDFPRLPGEHILDQALRLAGATPPAAVNWAAPASAARPDSRPALTAADLRDCTAWLERRDLTANPLVLLQPGNKKTMKRGDPKRRSNLDYWPEENWAAVIAGIHAALPAARIVVCGTPAETPLAESLVARVAAADRPAVVIATDELPIPRLLALQARAHSMISVNTGPAHSAAAVGCPLVVMFTRHPHRAADFYAMIPTTAPVRIVQPESTAPDAGLQEITPEGVLAAWRETLRL